MIRYWWINLLRGLLAVVLGILLFALPAMFTVLLLVAFFGAYMLLDGFGSIIFSLTHPKTNHRWWIFTDGILSILIAVIVFVWPGMTAVFLLYFIAFWAIFTGILEIIFSIAQWKVLPGKVWILIGGILSIIFGGLLLANPLAGALAVLWLIALYLILFGIALIIFSFWLRGQGKAIAQAVTS
ncbi:MAG: HdeD family acid-resistance protein [Dehalococcoidia bacterium]|nr:HdeD family acid-resistance protein [Dehalococcoidia bacterium]